MFCRRFFCGDGFGVSTLVGFFFSGLGVDIFNVCNEVVLIVVCYLSFFV